MSDPGWTPHRVAHLWLTRVHLCHWCDNPIARDIHPSRWNRATVDHLCPREYGGCSDEYNLVLCCRRCNEARAAAGHCIAALCCAVSVLGRGVEPGVVYRWYLGIRGPVGRDAESRARFPKGGAAADLPA
jgi:HNH endonuclease